MADPNQLSSKLNYKQAVLSTLAYFDIFRYPLTQEEVTRFLYKLEPDPHHVEVTLKESRLIRKRGSFYQLEGPEDHVATRHDRELIARRLWKRVDRFRWVFHLTPYVRLAAVCNNLALSNTSPESDIDLLIITKPGRLFVSRLILTAWLQVFGVRRHAKKTVGRFCLSFFAAEGALQCQALAKKPHDIYLAYWLQTLEPVAGNRDVYEALLAFNTPWAGQFFKGRLRYNMHHFKESPRFLAFFKKIQEKLLDTKAGQKLETKLGRWQLKRAQTKQDALNIEETDVIVARDLLKFHNKDKRNEIYAAWLFRLTALLKQT